MGSVVSPKRRTRCLEALDCSVRSGQEASKSEAAANCGMNTAAGLVGGAVALKCFSVVEAALGSFLLGDC